MPSRKMGNKRDTGRDAVIPAEFAKREAQDRAKGFGGRGRAQSPIDTQHADAPKRQDIARGHRQRRGG